MNNGNNELRSLNTPVLFIVFNRLDTTTKVFAAIRQAKPPRLYIAADGPRESREGEAEKVETVRNYVISHIDWPCEVKTLFREKNLGCKYAVSSGISWFFENEEQGIILEDDCLPDPSFFRFCEEMLCHHKNDMRIWHIGGANFQNGQRRGNASYYFSSYYHIWGWASWANRWKSYDVELSQIPDNSFLKNIFPLKQQRSYWNGVFYNMKNRLIDTWDYQWTLTVLYNRGIAIIPNVNLITNIGFGIDATHTTGSNNKMENLPSFPMQGQIQHPQTVAVDTDADIYTFITCCNPMSLPARIIKKIRRILTGK